MKAARRGTGAMFPLIATGATRAVKDAVGAVPALRCSVHCVSGSGAPTTGYHASAGGGTRRAPAGCVRARVTVKQLLSYGRRYHAAVRIFAPLAPMPDAAGHRTEF